MFKIEMVKKVRAKQLRILEKFESVENDITIECNKLITFEDQFHQFEKKLFDG